MKESFSYDKFIEYIKERKNIFDQPEDRYRIKFIPQLLYKYWSFESPYNNENIEKLLNGKIWMPASKTLNDPFEFQIITDMLTEEEAMAFRTDILSRNTILSLCDSYKNNLMWSHYGNAHTGLCIEFEVNYNNLIFPVTYCKNQIDETNSIRKWLKIKKDFVKKEIADRTIDELYLLANINKVMLYKSYDWHYEHEYRIIARNFSSGACEKITSGYWESLNAINIRVNRIILGFNCTIQNKAKIIDIINKFNEEKILKEMINTDFKYSIDYVEKKLKNENVLIELYQMERCDKSLILFDEQLKKNGRVYIG